jgi:hypothetical protein
VLQDNRNLVPGLRVVGVSGAMGIAARDNPAPGDLEAQRIVCTEVNRRRAAAALVRRGPDSLARFFCECGRLGCTTMILLALPDYDAIRAGPNRYVLAPGHEQYGLDSIVERRDGYVIVVESH